MSIAIFGGTFDPIHIGHLIIAEQAFNRYDLKKIIFMPAGNPPHKNNQNLTNAELRLQMVKIAIEDNDHFTFSDWELKKNEPSYTADTLRHFRDKYKEEIYFIIGADSLLDIPNWKEPEFLMKNGNFIVARRPNYSLEKILKKVFFKSHRDNLHIMNSSLIDISSSLIRNNIKKNRTIRYMTLDSIIQFINENNIYSG
ncbi:MAG: nicotinate-nucleotide adenylyltransferase [Bacillota bacterium]